MGDTGYRPPRWADIRPVGRRWEPEAVLGGRHGDQWDFEEYNTVGVGEGWGEVDRGGNNA